MFFLSVFYGSENLFNCIFWILGSSPTITEKPDKFKLLLEAIIAGLSFPRRRESIFSTVSIIFEQLYLRVDLMPQSPIIYRSIAGNHPQHADIGFHPQTVGDIIAVAAAVGHKFDVIVEMAFVHPQQPTVYFVVRQ